MFYHREQYVWFLYVLSQQGEKVYFKIKLTPALQRMLVYVASEVLLYDCASDTSGVNHIFILSDTTDTLSLSPEP